MAVLTTWLLQALIKRLAAQSPETREAWLNKLEAQNPATREARLKLEKLVAELPEKPNAADPKPRVPGTRWLPPPQVAPPALAVHLEGPDRLMPDYRREDPPAVAPTVPAVANRSSRAS